MTAKQPNCESTTTSLPSICFLHLQKSSTDTQDPSGSLGPWLLLSSAGCFSTCSTQNKRETGLETNAFNTFQIHLSVYRTGFLHSVDDFGLLIPDFTRFCLYLLPEEDRVWLSSSLAVLSRSEYIHLSELHIHRRDQRARAMSLP